MKVRAIAIAAEQSNAIGTVELECTPVGLAILFLGVGQYRQDYAPGPVTSGTEVVAPWSSVEQVRVEGDQIHLRIDPALSPHNRLTLVNFSTGDAIHHTEIYRQRIVLRIAVITATLLSVLIGLFTMTRISSRSAATSALVAAALAAAVILVVGLVADRRVARGGMDSDAAREALAGELALYLPTLIRSAHAPARAKKPLALPTFQGLLPRTTLAVIITLSASLLGAVLMARWMITNQRRAAAERHDPLARAARQPREPAGPEAAGPLGAALKRPSAPEEAPKAASPTKAGPAASVARAGEACRCERAHSALWEEAIPKLSILLLSSKLRQQRTRRLLELDIAVVNNSDQNIRELELQVQFFEVDPAPSEKRHFTESRVLYFAGPLVPGQAIKWNVEGEGGEFEVENPVSGDIGPGGDGAAPIQRFAELLQANHRPVRMHGAMMLSYFGDPRAKEATLKLQDALREDEAAYLRRLLQAQNEVRACSLQVAANGHEHRVRACIFNTTAETKKDLGFKLRALDGKVDHAFPVNAPPLVVQDVAFEVPGELGANTGKIVEAGFTLKTPDGRAPAMFEIVADRRDLLP